VHIASRVMATASPGEILVSRTVRDLVAGAEVEFDDRGTHALRGVGDDWQLFAVI
jgi:class 3 adenylate cyclase